MNSFDISQVDLNLLKTFEALYEERGASRAAVRLNVTQSTISAALSRLRTLYGDPLFATTGRGLRPTPRASELKPVITEALDRCRQSLMMANPDTSDFSGRVVTVGMSDDFEVALGRKLIDLVASNATGLRLVFRQTYSQIVAQALSDRNVDLAIAAGGFAASGLGRKVTGAGGYACLVDRSSLGEAGSSFSLSRDDYLSRGHTLVSSGGMVGIVDEELERLGLRRQIIASTTHFAGLPFLLAGSSAIATIPTHAARAIAAMTGLLMLPCPLQLPEYPIEVGWRITALRDPAVSKVLESIVGYLCDNDLRCT